MLDCEKNIIVCASYEGPATKRDLMVLTKQEHMLKTTTL